MHNSKAVRRKAICLTVTILIICVAMATVSIKFTRTNAIRYFLGLCLIELVELFVTLAILCICMIAGIIYFMLKKKKQVAKIKYLYLLSGCIIIGLVASCLLGTDGYMIDGKKLSRAEVIYRHAKDCIKKETERVEVSEMTIESEVVFRVGQKNSRDMSKRRWYVKLDENHRVRISYKCAEQLHKLAALDETIEATLYKESKFIKEINGLSISEYMIP